MVSRVSRDLPPEPRCSSVGLLVSLFRAVSFSVVFTLSRKTASQVVALRSGPPSLAVGDLPGSLEARSPLQGGLSVKMPSGCLWLRWCAVCRALVPP